LRVLQLNLCDSGIAGCYTGRAVAQAATVIRAEAPDVVTLDEICRGDLDVLRRALINAHPGGTVGSAFRAAGDRRTGGDFRCLDGQSYGIGVLARLPPPHGGHATDGGHVTDGGLYPVQDTGDPEERVWLCLSSAGDLYACATHLASTSATVALDQCRYLLGTALPELYRRRGYRPTVLGGDLNLRYGGSPDVRSCVPQGYARRDDSGVQHVLATPDLTVGSSATVGMAGTTDHPGLLVVLTAPAAPNLSIIDTWTHR
jgi:endonuclease/exonuclease/phosphatase family metal-dependent hydrolase